MWFIYVIVGLALLVITGLYVRRRITEAMRYFGIGERSVRIARWSMLWLLYGVPLLIIVIVIASRVLGLATLPRFDGLAGSWLLVFPFAWAMLVVFQAMPWLVVLEVAHLIVRRRRGAATAARVGSQPTADKARHDRSRRSRPAARARRAPA